MQRLPEAIARQYDEDAIVFTDFRVATFLHTLDPPVFTEIMSDFPPPFFITETTPAHPPPAQNAPIAQQLVWYEHEYRRIRGCLARTEQRMYNAHVRATDREAVAHRLTEENAKLQERINEQVATISKQATTITQQAATINRQAASIQQATKTNQQNTKTNKQANTIKHQNQLIQSQNLAELGSQGPLRIASGIDDQPRNSSSTSNAHQAIFTSNRSTNINTVVDNSQALVTVGNTRVADADGLTRRFEQVYRMIETFALTHVNFVSVEKDANLPQTIKTVLLEAAAPAQAFPFMSKPGTRYHLVTKVITTWINENIINDISFAEFNQQVDAEIVSARSTIFQGTPSVVKAMHLNNFAKAVKGLVATKGYSEWQQHICRNKCGELWAVVKPMMHQHTRSDWDDLFVLVSEAHKLGVAVVVSANEVSFESVEVRTPFDHCTMINKEEAMMGGSGEDLVRGGAVVKLGITPKVRARAYGEGGSAGKSLLYPAMVLTRWRH